MVVLLLLLSLEMPTESARSAKAAVTMESVTVRAAKGVAMLGKVARLPWIYLRYGCVAADERVNASFQRKLLKLKAKLLS